MAAPTSDAREMANRCRAAIAYSGLSIQKLEGLTGISAGTLTNMASRTRPNGHDPQRLRDLAAATGMPLWFLRGGPDAAESSRDDTSPSELAERLAALERIVREAFIGRTEQGGDIISRLDKLEAAIAQRVEKAVTQRDADEAAWEERVVRIARSTPYTEPQTQGPARKARAKSRSPRG